MKYIDAEKLIAEIERLNSLVSYESKDRHDEGLHDAYKAVKNVICSLQQDEKAVELEMCSQAYWEERGWMMIPPDVTLKGIESLLEQVRNKLQQEQPQVADASKMEQPEVNIEEEIENEWKKCYPTDEGMGLESANIVKEQFDTIAYHFYELGASIMRKRITNPEFNQKVIEKMKYECPVDEFNARTEDK